MKKIISLTLALCMLMAVLFTVTGCGKTKLLHCDGCNKEVFVDENSNMEEDWIIYCEECNEELFGDDPILGTGE